MEDSDEAEQRLESGVQVEFEEFDLNRPAHGPSNQYKIVQGLDGQLFVISGLGTDDDGVQTADLHHVVQDGLDVHLDGEMGGIQAVVEIPNDLNAETVDEDIAGSSSGRDPLRVGIETYDDTIESVIRGAAETVTEDELRADFFEKRLQEKKRRMQLQKRKISEKDISKQSLPFQYSGQSFNTQSQKLILNVMHFLKEHKKRDDDFIESVKTPQEKAARVLNISSSVIGKIRKNWSNGKLEQPGKTRNMTKRVLDSVSQEDEAVIRLIVRELLEKRLTPSIPVILSEARQRINFLGSRTSFRRILYRMGFRYGKVDKKVVMIDSTVGTRPMAASTTRTAHARQKSKPSKKSSSPQITHVYSTAISSQQSHTLDDDMIGPGQPSAQIQIVQHLNDESDILLDTEPQLLFQVEGQNYCFQLVQTNEDT